MIEHERESADAFRSPVGGAIGTRGGGVVLDTFAGRVHVEWEPAAPVTALGQLPFFVEFLKHVRQLGGSLSPALYRVSTLSGLRYTVDLTSKREFSLACTNERF